MATGQSPAESYLTVDKESAGTPAGSAKALPPSGLKFQPTRTIETPALDTVGLPGEGFTSEISLAVSQEARLSITHFLAFKGLAVGKLMSALFDGDASTTGSTGYTHAWTTSANASAPTLVEVVAGEGDHRQWEYNHMAVESLELACESGQAVRATWGLRGDFTQAGASISAPSADVTLSAADIAKTAEMGWSWNAVADKPNRGSLRITRPMEMLNEIGSLGPQGAVQSGPYEIELTLTYRRTSNSMWAGFIAGTLADGTLTIGPSTTKRWEFVLRNAQVVSYSTNQIGDGVIEETVVYRAHRKSNGTQAILVNLKNQESAGD